ncbi:MAG: hypothetical protein JWO68_3215 [Actinomycetia bacterium]|nr:hypothetical protein [Actinomycetes bacterium]
MKHEEWKLKAGGVIGAVLSIPVVRRAMDGSISWSSAAIRVGIAMVLAYGGVLLVTSVVGGYFPEPEPEPGPAELVAADGVEDAVLVDEDRPVMNDLDVEP